MKAIRSIAVLSLCLLLAFACACNNDEPDVTPTGTTAGTEAEAPTEAAATDAPTVPATDAPTEPATEAPTEASTEAPTKAATEADTKPAEPAPTAEKTVFADFNGRSGKPDINGSDGWNFNSTNYALEFKDDKLVVSGLNGEFVSCRLALNEEQRGKCSADVLDTMDAIGFYIENNSDEVIGVCYFGEITRPDMPGEHQQMYTATPFSSIKCWLMDMDGNLTKCSEYYHDNYAMMDHGLCEIPAHFKGYYVCELTSLGHDQCVYGAWGDHNAAECGNGTYVKGSSITNIGFSLVNSNPAASDNYVIGEYVLVKLK